MLAILVAEDIVIALVLGFASGGGGATAHTLAIVAKAIGFIAAALADLEVAQPARSTASSTGCRARSSCWPSSPSSSASAALAPGARPLGGDRRADGGRRPLGAPAIREEIEERFFSFRDVFAALFFFVFGLSIDVGKARQRGLDPRSPSPWC